eukprot:3915183-Lingulodinium_polyedra.AAC.1
MRRSWARSLGNLTVARACDTIDAHRCCHSQALGGCVILDSVGSAGRGDIQPPHTDASPKERRGGRQTYRFGGA